LTHFRNQCIRTSKELPDINEMIRNYVELYCRLTEHC
jgi:hypothetical protein